MFQSTIKPYNDLSKDQFFDILKLRIEIFVVEQCCYYQELEDEDKEAVEDDCSGECRSPDGWG